MWRSRGGLTGLAVASTMQFGELWSKVVYESLRGGVS